MDKVNERLSAFSAAAQGRFGRLVKYLVSSTTRDGRKRGRTVFSQLDPNITTEQEKSPDRKRRRKTGTMTTGRFFQKQVRNMSLLQSQFKLYPNHMVLLKEGDSVTITFRDMNGLTTFLWNFLW